MNFAWDALRLLPAAVALVVAPATTHHYDVEHSCIVNVFDRRLTAKLITGGSLIALTFLDIAVADFNSKVAAVATGVSISGMLSLLWILYAEHRHSPKPYAIVSALLGLDVVTSTIHWLNIVTTSNAFSPSSLLALANLAVKLCLLVLHEQSNWTNFLPAVSRRLDRQKTYGFWGRCFSVSFLDQLTWDSAIGLTPININRKDPGVLDSLPFRKFSKSWDENHESNRRLLWACIDCLKQEAILAGVAVVFKAAFRLAVPFWIEEVISYSQQQELLSQPASANDAKKLLILRTFIILIGWLISESCARYAISTMKLGVQSVVAEVILARLQKRPSAEATRQAKLSLIADDVPQLAEAVNLAYTTIGSILEAFFLICFLGYRNILVMLILTLYTILLAVPLKSLGEAAAEAASKATAALGERSNAVATMIMSMQGATTLGHKSAMLDIIQKLREQEKETYQSWRASRVSSTLIQVALNHWYEVYLLTFERGGNYQTGAIPAFFKMFTQGLFFKSTTRSASAMVPKFSLTFEAVNRVQQFLQLPFYEVDARYVTLRKRQSKLIVQFKSASITTESDDSKSLKNVTITFIRGSLTIITGNEKRSLILQAAAGNCTIANGTVRLRDRSVSYCGKDSWIENKSIKDNIIGDEEFDENWYQQVVRACCLEDDIMSLPNLSDFVAMKGTSKLDAGQLQRLTLARTVYSRATILLLDDVLCYQDAAARAHLLDNLFAPGGLLRNGATVVITADDWDAFTNIGARFVSVTDLGTVSRTTHAQLITTEALLNPDLNHTRQLKKDYLAGSATQLMTQELISRRRSEELIPTSSEPATLSTFIGGAMVPFLLIILLLGITTAMETIQTRSTLHWVEAGPLESRPLYTVLFCGAIAGPTWALAVWMLSISLIHSRSNEIFEELLSTIASAKYEFFTDAGIEHAVRLTCEGFKTFSYDSHIQIGFWIYQCLCVVAYITVAAPSFTGVLLMGLYIMACYLVHRVYYSIWQRLNAEHSDARQALQAQFIDTVTGSVYIRALGWNLKHALQSRKSIDRHDQTAARIDSLQRLDDLFVNLVTVSLLVLISLIAMHTDMQPLQLGAALFVCLILREDYWLLMRAMNGFRSQLCILKDMNDFIEKTPRENADTTTPLPKDFQVEGEIKFANASFGYQQNRAHWLRQITMVIPKGARFGVFGASRSGKSALMLVLRGLVPYTGSITLDGREIRDIPRNHLADMFAMLPEKPVIFPGATVMQTLFPSEILRPGRAQSRQHIISIILHRLGLLDMINEVGGYEGKFEDLFLTKDQVYLFSLARLIGEHLIGRGSIFLIDGVTGRVSLDTHTRMRHVIRDFLEMGNRTMMYTFGNDTLVLHSTHISQIVERNIIPVPLGAPVTA